MKKKSKREEILDRERKILKETLDIIVQENSELKTELSDIQSNVNENKMQLKQVINSITDKNTAVEILTNQIEQLRQKFYDFQLKQKMQSLLNNNISEDVINSKGNDTNNNNSNNTNNKLMHIKEEQEKNMKEKEEQMKTIEGKIERQKNFFDNQQEIRNEIINLKRDVNFLQQKINEHKSKFILYQHNCDIQNYFKHNDLNNIKKFLNKSQKDNLIYLVTNSGNVYKIYKREDLSKNNFLNGINLDFISTQRQNEIINIREKIKKDIAVRKLMEERLREKVKPVEEADAKALYANVEAVLKNNTKKLKALEKEDPAKLKEAQLIAAKIKQLTGEQVRIGHIYLAVTKDMSAEEAKQKEKKANAGKIYIYSDDDKYSWGLYINGYMVDRKSVV